MGVLVPPKRKKAVKRPAKVLIDVALSPGMCVRCNRLVLHGFDAGVPIAVDNVKVSVDGEIACIIEGRPVYNIVRGYAYERTGTDFLNREHPVKPGHWCTGERTQPKVVSV